MAEKSERPTKNMDTVDAELQIGLLPGMRQEADASNSDRPDPVGNHAQDKRTSSEKYASRSIRLRKVTYVYRRQAGQVACFKEYPVTVTMMYAAHGVFSLTSMSAVRSTISNFNLGFPVADQLSGTNYLACCRGRNSRPCSLVIHRDVLG
jgi:hypothetical protein